MRLTWSLPCRRRLARKHVDWFARCGDHRQLGIPRMRLDRVHLPETERHTHPVLARVAAQDQGRKGETSNFEMLRNGTYPLSAPVHTNIYLSARLRLGGRRFVRERVFFDGRRLCSRRRRAGPTRFLGAPKNGRPCAVLMPVTRDTDLEMVAISHNKRFWQTYCRALWPLGATRTSGSSKSDTGKTPTDRDW